MSTPKEVRDLADSLGYRVNVYSPGDGRGRYEITSDGISRVTVTGARLALAVLYGIWLERDRALVNGLPAVEAGDVARLERERRFADICEQAAALGLFVVESQEDGREEAGRRQAFRFFLSPSPWDSGDRLTQADTYGEALVWLDQYQRNPEDYDPTFKDDRG